MGLANECGRMDMKSQVDGIAELKTNTAITLLNGHMRLSSKGNAFLQELRAADLHALQMQKPVNA